VSKICRSSKRIIKRINKTGKKQEEILDPLNTGRYRKKVIRNKPVFIRYNK
jgi:hypothetical protein